MITKELLDSIPEVSLNRAGFFPGQRDALYAVLPMSLEDFSRLKDWAGCYPAHVLLWLLYYQNKTKKLRQFACDCADRVIERLGFEITVDPRVVAALGVARLYSQGEVSAQELADAKYIVRHLKEYGSGVVFSACYSDDFSAAISASDSARWAMRTIVARKQKCFSELSLFWKTGVLMTSEMSSYSPEELLKIHELCTKIDSEEYQWQVLRLGEYCGDL